MVPADELLEVGDVALLGADLRILLEEGVQAFEDRGLPATEELGMEVVLAAEFGLAGLAAEEFKNDLGFELIGERTSSAWHHKVSLAGPVYTRLLVQRQGRTTFLSYTKKASTIFKQNRIREQIRRHWHDLHASLLVE